MTVKIYHNPRCSKSRQTLELLRANNVEPEIIEYLKEQPSEAQIKELVEMLGVNAIDIVRKKEAEYKDAGLKADSTNDEVIVAIAKYPKLLERPIVVNGNKAAVGRPPENVLAII